MSATRSQHANANPVFFFFVFRSAISTVSAADARTIRANAGQPKLRFRNPAAALPFRVIRQPARYSFMLAAAFLPSPMARMTVAAPSTMSPPAHTFVLLVACLSSTTM